MRRRTLLALVGSGAAASLAGCSAIEDALGDVGSSYSNGVMIACSGGGPRDGRIAYDCETFDGAAGRYFDVEAGDAVTFAYEATLRKGRVTFSLRDPDGRFHWKQACGHSRSYDDEGSVSVDDGGRWEMRVEGNQAGGSFELTWDA